MKKMIARLVVWSWYVAAAVLVLSAVLVSLGQYYFPYVSDYRKPLIERVASAFPFGIEVASLNAEWTGLAPTFHLRGLRLYARDDPTLTILAATRSEVRIDILASLGSLAPRLRKIVVEDVQLGFTESADGTWQIAGIERRKTAVPTNPDQIASFFLAIEEIDLQRARLLFRPQDGEHVETRDAQLTLENFRRFRRLRARAFDESGAGALDILVEAHGDPRQLADFDAEAYIRFDQVDIGRLRALLGPQFHGPVAKFDGELWLQLDPGGRIEWSGRLDTRKFEFGALLPDRDVPPLGALELLFAGQWERGQATLWVERAAAQWFDKALSFERLRLDLGGGAGKRHLRLGTDYLDLGALGIIARELAKPGTRIQSAIADLQPYGGLANVHLDLSTRPDASPDYRLRARMIDVSASPWQHAPGVRNVAGFLEVLPGRGSALLQSGAVSLEFPRIYGHDLAFDSVSGRVNWQFDESGVQVDSERLQIMDAGTAIDARFDLRFRVDPRLDDELSLAIGLHDADVARRNKYIPYLVDTGLRKWLDSSIVGGFVDSGGFSYHAIFKRDQHPGSSTMQLGLDARDAALSYHPDWPAVSAVSARLLVDGPRIHVKADSGQLLHSRIGSATVEVVPQSSGKRLRVTARMDGELADGLRIINESPIAAMTGGALREWQAQGALQANLNMDMPFGGTLDPQNARLTLQADISGGVLSLNNFRVQLEELGGRMEYDLATGLRSDRLDASLWGRPVRATISESEPGTRRMRIDAQGSVDMAQLGPWLQLDTLDFVAGAADFNMRLEQQAEGGMKMAVTSDLQGLESRLPAPLAKEATTALGLELELWPARRGMEYHATIGEALSAAVYSSRSGALSGEIMFGAQAQTGGNGLRIGGVLETADVGAWISASEQLLAANAGSGPRRAMGLHLQGLQVAEASLFSATLNGLNIDSHWEHDDFVLDFSADVVSGSFRVPAERGAAFELQLAQLQLQPFLPQKDAAEESSGNWDGLRDVRVPDIDVVVQKASLGAKDLGRWSFHLGSAENEIAMTGVEADMPGIRLRGPGAAGGASFRLGWIGEMPQSELAMTLGIDDLGSFFESWGYDRVLESRKGRIDVAFHWPDYPTALKMAEIQGLMDFELEEGSLTKEGANNPLMRALGVFSFNEVLRRLKFDFKDLYQEGLGFDRFTSAIDFERGVARTREPLELQGPSARIRMSGVSDLRAKTVDADLVVTLPIGSNLPWLAALAGGLPVAAGVYVASRIFENQIGKFSSAVYKVSGPLDEPKLDFVKVFDAAEPARQETDAAAQPAAEAIPEPQTTPEPSATPEPPAAP